MAFNINAQVILSGPKNLGKISKQIQTSLGKSGAIKVKIDPGSLRNIKILNSTIGTLNTNIASLNSSASKLQSTLNGVNRNLSKASSATSSFSKSQSNTASSIKNVNNALQQQNQQLGNLGKRFLSTAKTAIAFGLISRPIYDLQRAFIGATKDAVAFEREIVKISQVTGQTVKQLSNLRSDINRLSTSLGVSANELAETARIIAQTGQTAQDTRIILEALSRSTLAPTFGSITDTTEGLVAALSQFNLDAKDSEAILGALNRVSKNFAVEAEDLISVIRRTGGVFAQAAGDSRNTIDALEELIAIFTAVRSTTRESADTIAAGLRTIFSRIQRRGTIEFLEQFNIQLTNAKGEFIGVFPAFDELSRKLDTLIKQGDALTLSAIAEELGGIRQIGKLLPAIAQFDKARSALEEAQRGAAEGLSGDVAKGLDTIDNRLKRVRESFSELIRTVFESPAFQAFAKTILTVSEELLKLSTNIVKFIEPLLPVLAALGAAKLGQVVGGAVGGGGLAGAASAVTGQATATNTAQAAAAAQQSVSIEQQMLSVLNQTSTQLSNIFNLQSADNKLRNNQLSNIFQAINQQAARSAAPTVVGGFGGPRRRASGGQIYGFNRGGMVPGTGNRDTVPAMLTPGEFVIKKSSVESIGADQLASMNKYAAGGLVVDFKDNTFGGVGFEGDVAGAQLATITKPENVNNIKAAIAGKLPTTGAKRGKLIGDSGIGKDFDDKFNEAKDTDKIKLTENAKANIASKAGIRKNAIPTTKKGLKDLGIFKISEGQDKKVSLEGLESIGLRGIVSSFASTNEIRDAGLMDEVETFTKEAFSNLISDITKSEAFSQMANGIGVKGTPLDPSDESLQTAVAGLINSDPKSARTTIEGYVLEGLISAIGKIPLEGGEESFDFRGMSGRATSISEGIDDIFGSGTANDLSRLKAFDAKRKIDAATRRNIILKKIPTFFDSDDVANVSIAKRNKGGGISGEDTVPALLTPGEFVFSKKSASRIGYGNLNRMNKDGVQGFNKGGVVGFKNGGKATGGASVNLDGFQKAAGQAVQGFGNLTSTALLLQGTFSSTGSLFEEGGLTFSNVIGSVTNSLFAFQAVLQTVQTAQALGGLTDLAGNLKSFSGNIKNLPKTLKGFGNSFKNLGKGLRSGKGLKNISASFKTGGLGKGPNAALNKAIGQVTGKLGNFSSFLTKQAGSKGIGAAVSNGLLKLGPSLGTAIGTPLAAGVASAVGTALIAIPVGKFVGEALGTSLDKALFGAREEVAGFQGREGQSSGDAAASGAVKEGFATAGLGAGIGAAVGSIIPGIGTAIGAAAGAGIGAVIGGSVGIIIGSINGPLEQASFEAAKKIQTSQEEVSKSLEAFSKSGSLADYDAFINDFIDAGDAQNQAFETFTNQFDNAVGLFDFTPFGIISNTFSAFSNALQGDTVRVTKSQTQAIERIESLIDPKQVEAARKGLSQGLQKLADTGELGVDFQGIDFSTREGQQEGRARLKQKASEDPEGRAAKLLQAETKQIKDELSVAAKQFKDGSGFFGFFKSESQKTGEALTSLRAAAESGQVDIQDEGQVSAFLEKFGDAGAEAAKELDKIKESGDGALGAAISAGLLSKALREAEKALNTFNAELKTIQDDLAFATASSALAMTNLKDTTDALSNGQILFTKKLDGFDFGKAGAGARQDRIAAIGQATDVDVEGIQKFDTVISNADDIGKDVFKDLKEREVDGKASLQDVTSALEKGIEKELGFELPEGPLKEGLKKSLEGFGRQLGDGSDIPLDKLGEAIEDGKVAELLGPAFAEVQNTTKALSETFNQLNSIAAEEANLRLQIAQEQIKAQKEVRKRERGIEDTAIDPEKAFKGDPLKLAQKRLDEDIADLGFADKSAVEIAKAQQVARDKQLELNEKLQSGAISADEFAIQASKAASENANASAALNQLANDTTQLSAIQQKAAKLIANRDASRKQATDELVARETGDVIGIARRRESSRMVQAGLADGASQGDRRRLLVAAAQDQSLQQEIALQERMRDPEGTSGKTAQQIFDETLIKDLEAQAAIETDPLEKARIEQQIEDIKAPGLEELQKQAVDVQRNQLAVQELIASNQQLLLAAQLAGTEEEKAVLQAKLTENTQKLNGLLQNNEKTAQEQQALNETLEPTPVTTAGADIGSSAAGGVITRGNLGEANAPVLVPLTPSPLVAGNTGFNPTEEQILRASVPNPQQQSQQGMENFATILQEGLVAFVEKVDLIQAAAELQNQASERQLEAANGMPTQIAHNMNPIEINGFADLPRALNEFANNIGAIAQNMIDPSQKYQGPSDQGGGIDPRTLG